MKNILFLLVFITPLFTLAGVKNISTYEVLTNVELVDSYERVPDCPANENCTTVMEHYIKLGFSIPACGSSIKNIHYSLNNVFNWRTKQPTLYVTALAHANIIKKLSK